MILKIIPNFLLKIQFLHQLVIILLAYCVLNTALFFRARRKRYRTFFRQHGIPGPEPSLLDGHLRLYLAGRGTFTVNKRLRELYGNVFGVFIGDEPTIVIYDLDLLKKVFLENFSSFKERSNVFMEMPLTHSILFARHDRWKAMRKIITPAFSSYTIRGKKSTQFVEDSVRLMIEYIDNKFETTNNHNIIDIDMHDLMKSTALYMISTMAIDLPNVQVREKELNVANMDAYLSSVDSGLVLWAVVFPFLKRLIRLVNMFVEFDPTMASIRRNLNKKIDLRRATDHVNNDNNQLIDKLIELHWAGKLSRKEVVGNAEAILFAGYDTTSTTLAYIFWALGKHMGFQEKLRQELQAHGMESKYLEQVIQETMRLYPVAVSFTSRLATETIDLGGGLTLPQGVRVMYPVYWMHRDANLWPEPEKFDPERFREGVDIHPCAFAPFGLGERRCLGYLLAKLEIKMIICDILMRYRVRTKAPENLELTTYASVLTKPKEKILMQVEKLEF